MTKAASMMTITTYTYVWSQMNSEQVLATHFRVTLHKLGYTVHSVMDDVNICSPIQSHLLDVGHSIALREGVRVSLPEDMSHTRTRDDLQGPSTHPYAEGNLYTSEHVQS